MRRFRSPYRPFLGFLFTVSGQDPLTSSKCREVALAMARKEDRSLKVLETSEIDRPKDMPVVNVSYSAKRRDGSSVYSVRGFLATADICGDLELYSDTAITPEQADISKIFQSYRFDPDWVPQFEDVFLYGQILFRDQRYKEAAPIFEQALAMLPEGGDQRTLRRVTIDQAGMAYGISGDTKRARALFEAAIVKDPDYPMYYYNLACADAQEKNLAGARVHLRQALERKSNVIPGESMPNPAEDDSFSPYRRDKDFWKFVEGLH